MLREVTMNTIDNEIKEKDIHMLLFSKMLLIFSCLTNIRIRRAEEIQSLKKFIQEYNMHVDWPSG